jgi:hypothetical protein
MSRIAAQQATARNVLATALLAIAFAVLLAIGLGSTTAAVAAPSAAQYQYTSFLGSWVSSEPDGSVLTLKISSLGNTVNVTVTDSIVNGFCGGEALTAKGTGVISGSTLTTSVTGKCKRQKGTVGPLTLTFQDNGDGTLSGIGVTWTRP